MLWKIACQRETTGNLQRKSERKGKVNSDYFLGKSWTTTNLRIAVSKRSTRRMLTVKANTKTFKNKQDKNNWNKKQHLDKHWNKKAAPLQTGSERQ